MSFKKEYSGAGFADRFKIGFKDQIQDQIKVCREAVTADNDNLINSSVLALQLLVTPRIADPIYYQKVDEINTKWEIEYDKLYNEYIRQCNKAICPDVIEIPSDAMPLKYTLAVYSNIQALFERRKLLLESERNENL